MFYMQKCVGIIVGFMSRQLCKLHHFSTHCVL